MPSPSAIIDIGSNSVRLVVYAGPPRIPTPIFNEKVLAGLGAGLEQTGKLRPRARGQGAGRARRFRLLLDHMKVKRTRVRRDRRDPRRRATAPTSSAKSSASASTARC